MSSLPSTPARRLERPGWRDSRLLIGLVLVLVAAALGAKAVASTDDRTPVWALVADVPAGSALQQTALRRVDVRLDDSLARYASASTAIPDGSFTARDLRAGELLPASAVIPADRVDTQRVTLSVPGSSAQGLVTGSRVDVFSSMEDKATGEVSAARILEDIPVAEVMSGTGSLGSSRSAGVALLVPRDKVQVLIEAMNGDGTVSLVPVAGSLTASAQ